MLTILPVTVKLTSPPEINSFREQSRPCTLVKTKLFALLACTIAPKSKNTGSPGTLTSVDEFKVEAAADSLLNPLILSQYVLKVTDCALPL